MAAGDQVAERLGGELAAVESVGVVGDQGGDFFVDGGEDRGAQLGMEQAADAVHPVALHTQRQVGVATLLLVAFDPLIAFEAGDHVATVAGELLW